MLRYTGHPYIDIGVATITAFAGKKKPEQLSLADLEAIADYMAENYTVNPLRSFLTVVFQNSGFTQSAYFESPEKQQIYAERILRAFRSDTPTTGELDSFLQAPIPAVPFDVKGELPFGRAFRQHIPLLTGEDVINFSPDGEAGMPISGEGILAIQSMPLGCAKCDGKLLAVHSDNPDIVLHFARKFLEENRQSVQLARQDGNAKLPETKLRLRTLVIETLLKASQLQQEYREDERPFSITAYHISNFGQDPFLGIYHLPSQVVSYLRIMMSADYQDDWAKIVQYAWEIPPEKKAKKEQSQTFTPRKNYLYEDLFTLPENASRFIRVYFLRSAMRYARGDKSDPRSNYSFRQESNLVSWKVTESFIRSILNMDKELVEQIRNLGDKLGEYVHQTADKGFYTKFFSERRYDYFRDLLMQVNRKQLKSLKPPIITLDEFYYVFEADIDDIPRYDRWKLARDLVLIRMTEYLYKNGQIESLVEALPEQDDIVQE